MDHKNPKMAPFLILAIGIAILLVSNIVSTPLSISDVDPSTYIIVPMLMLVPFSIFMYKLNIIPNVKRSDVYYGIALFLLFILLTLYTRFDFPLLSESFKTDMLFFPLAIASFVTLLFGIKNAKRFWPLMLYSIFASPVLLMFIFNLNPQFASLNTQIIYAILHASYKNVSYIAPITINFNGTLIGIGEACAGIGAIIAIVMFLSPVAYFYDGKTNKKIYWIISGVLLLFILNLLRMFGISVLWIYYGLAASASFIHLFAGILVFYLSIIIMILISYKYHVQFPSMKNQRPKKKASPQNKNAMVGYIIVILLALLYLYSSYPFTNLPQTSPLAFHQNSQSNITSAADISAISKAAGNATAMNYTVSPEAVNSTGAIALIITNSTFNYTHPMVLLLTTDRNYSSTIINNNTLLASNYYVDAKGNEVILYDLESDNTSFFVAYATVITGSSLSNADVLYVYFIIPANTTLGIQNCKFNVFDSYIYSIFGAFNGKEGNFAAPFCVSDRLISSMS